MVPWRIEFYSARMALQVESWPTGIRAGFLRVAEAVESHGPDLGLPHTRALGGRLFEIRAHGREGIGRALFCLSALRRVVILHVFVKKSARIPARELAVARKRHWEVSEQ